MKNIKNLTLLLAALICSATINAQGIKIYQKNGTILDLSYAEIDSIVAYDDTHEAVDLGLSVKWATCNVGAESPEEYGDYFAWGETEPKETYTADNSKTYGKTIGDIAGYPEYDAATANWGGSWRMPTRAECEELVHNCTWEWTSLNGVFGFKVTSNVNGNSIFLPTSGYRNGGTLYDDDAGYDGGACWISTPDDENDNTQRARTLHIDNGHYGLSFGDRFTGLNIRPVKN